MQMTCTNPIAYMEYIISYSCFCVPGDPGIIVYPLLSIPVPSLLLILLLFYSTTTFFGGLDL